MGGVIAVIIGFLLALFLFTKGLSLKLSERRLSARLVETTGRVTGESSGTEVFVSTDANGNRTERLDRTYEGRYEYQVGGKTFTGKVDSSSPIFSQKQMPPNKITVYYDRDDPSISRLSGYPDTTGNAYMIFAMVVFAVAGLMMIIANLEHNGKQKGSSTQQRVESFFAKG